MTKDYSHNLVPARLINKLCGNSAYGFVCQRSPHQVGVHKANLVQWSNDGHYHDPACLGCMWCIDEPDPDLPKCPRCGGIDWDMVDDD